MRDYYRLQKFNVIELSSAKNASEDASAPGAHRVGGKRGVPTSGNTVQERAENPQASEETVAA